MKGTDPHDTHGISIVVAAVCGAQYCPSLRLAIEPAGRDKESLAVIDSASNDALGRA